MEQDKLKCSLCDEQELGYQCTDTGEYYCYDCGQELYESRVTDELNLEDIADQIEPEDGDRCSECNTLDDVNWESHETGELMCTECLEREWWDTAGDVFTPEDVNLIEVGNYA